MPRDLPEHPLSVSLLALPEGTPFALFALYEVFASVGVAWLSLTGEATDVAPVEVKIVAPARHPFTCSLGVPVAPHRALAEVEATDLVIVPDLALPVDEDPRGRWPEASAWLRRRFDDGAVICSVCSGSILLADAGLLDGGEATTHWGYRDLFAEYFPKVTLRPERVLVISGSDERIVTSGGASSWEDLVLYLIARFCGEAEAVRIAKIFLFGDRSDGQLPYFAMRRLRQHEDRAIAEVQTWIAEHYEVENPVQRMVERSGLHERTFKRRFKAATGLSPVEYVQILRIEEAKQLLETTAAAPEEIAQSVGYTDPTFFRRLFKRTAGVTPSRYRQRFRPIARPSGDAARLAG